MNMVGRFYRLFRAGDFGVAYSAPEVDSAGLIPDHGEVTSWNPLELVVRPGEWGGPLADYVNSDLGVRLCSRRFKDLLDDVRSEIDKVQWLPVFVTNLEGKRIEYYILHFPEPPDVLNLDPGETIYDDESGVLIRPCLSLNKAGQHKLFNIPGLEIATIVDESVKQASEAAGMQGMEFSPIRTR
jgi:hypothetical protein